MRLITPIIFIALALALFFGYIDPTYSHVQELRAQDNEFDQALARSKELLAIRDALLSKYNEIPSEQLDRLKKLLPDHVDSVRLILDIDNIAKQYGLSVQDLAFAADNAGPAGQGAQGQLGPTGDQIGSATLSFSFDATYEVMKQFLTDLEDSLRLVDVVSLSFSGTDQTGINSYKITLRTYWLK